MQKLAPNPVPGVLEVPSDQQNAAIRKEHGGAMLSALRS